METLEKTLQTLESKWTRPTAKKSPGSSPPSKKPGAKQPQGSIPDRSGGFQPEKAWQREHLAGLKVTHPMVQEMADAVLAFCARWMKRDDGQRNLVLVGNSGCGKTHVAKAAAAWARSASFSAWEKGFWNGPPSVGFVKWAGVVQGFKEKEFGALQDLFGYDLLVLDDIGAENDAFKEATEKLCQVLDRREDKFTLVTTNIGVSKWGERFSHRVEDRLMRNSVVVDMSTVPSYAIWKMEKK